MATRPNFKSRVCAHCGEQFTPSGPRSRYCGHQCKLASRRAAYEPKPKRQPRPLAERLWSRVAIGAPDECWEWGGFRKDGYGQIGAGRRQDGLIGTHRAAWVVTYGDIPAGLVVRHSCDNPPCCNPSHLSLGTHADNARDAFERGRTAREMRLPHCRLSDSDIEAIRSSWVPAFAPRGGPRAGGLRRSNARELAERYGVTEGYITQIIRNAYRREVA